tara:strand:- start:27797 stop:27985 length:189 start_codon:yes stop_codon:yes gene_type:complete
MPNNKESKLKTESISLRVDAELKKELFELLDSQDKTFSKWLRSAMIDYIKQSEQNENEVSRQ